jgi:hypothetical protein
VDPSAGVPADTDLVIRVRHAFAIRRVKTESGSDTAGEEHGLEGYYDFGRHHAEPVPA